MHNSNVKTIEDRKVCGISLTPEWSNRLESLRERDRQSSAAAQVRLMIMNREDELKKLEENKK